MKSLVVVALLYAPASADPKVCKADGEPLVALRHLGSRKVPVVFDDTPPPAITGGFVIWPTGGFRSYDEDPDTGKTSNHRDACLDDADFKTVKTLLAKATWKFKTAKVKCMAMSVDHTEWTAHDKLVWDDKMCSGQTADAPTRAAIDAVKAIAAKVTK